MIINNNLDQEIDILEIIKDKRIEKVFNLIN